MRDQFSNTQQIRKPAVTSKGGIVAAQSRKAAEIGAEVLAAGGDCVDAVVATTFALGVLEPWMSGLGGGGAMVLYRARDNRYEVIDYGMRAPDSLRVEDYPLAGDGVASDMFPGRGSRTIATCTAPARSRCPAWSPAWKKRIAATPKCRGRNLLAPEHQARRRRPRGGLVDHADDRKFGGRSAALSRERGRLSGQTACRRMRNGASVRVRLPQDRFKATLAHLAAAGPRDFYQGDLARSIAADIQAAGGALSVEDLAAFRAHLREPLAIPYRGGKVYATPELTGGPTLAHTLRLLQQNLKPAQADRMHRPTRIMRWRCNRPIANGCRTWAMPTAAARSAPSIWRRPAPRISRRWTATATWRR